MLGSYVINDYAGLIDITIIFIVLIYKSDRCLFRIVKTRIILAQITYAGRLWPRRQVLTVLKDFWGALGYDFQKFGSGFL
jgi:hypothetical protein